MPSGALPSSGGSKARKKPALERPYSAMASHVSAPPNGGGGGDRVDLGDEVELVAGVAARVGQALEDGRRGRWRHGKELPVPSGIATNPYDVGI
jgi:hypothetical protein